MEEQMAHLKLMLETCSADIKDKLLALESQLRYRKVAVEIEIRTRLQALCADGLLPKDLNFKVNADIMKALNAALKLKGGLAYIKRLKGLFAYDIKFSPEYMHCLQMKNKLEELRKLVRDLN